MREISTSAAALLALVSLPLVATPASAVPRVQPITLVCEGETVEVTVRGRGDFTPGHIAGSSRVFIPVAISERAVVGTTPYGTHFRFTEPAVDKGRSARKVPDLVTCDFSLTFSQDGASGTVSGTVTGFFTPRR